MGKNDRLFKWRKPGLKPRYSSKALWKRIPAALSVRALHEVPVGRLSFKGTVAAARQYSVAIAQARSKKKQRELVRELSKVIACDQVPDRPGRREPRAVKRRLKPYPLLNRPRRRFKDIAHRNRYWKNNPRNTRG